MKKKRAAVLIGIAVAVAAVGGLGYYYREQLMDIIPFFQGSSKDKVYVQKVSRIMNQATGVSNRYNGIVETQETYEVNVDSSRTIEEILVSVGDEVVEGQDLATYDTSDIDLQIRQAELEKEEINNEISNYNKQIETLKKERSETTDGDTFSYTTEIQSLENLIAQSRYDLDSKQLEIDKYEEELEKSTVVAKQGGIVKEINESGVDGNGDSAAFMTILKAGDYRVKGSIDEQNVWTIDVGAEVLIRSRVQEDAIWKGTITEVDTENIESDDSDYYYYDSGMGESTTKYPFYIELETADGLLLGQHVYIEMDEGQDEEKEGLWLFASYIVQEGGEDAEQAGDSQWEEFPLDAESGYSGDLSGDGAAEYDGGAEEGGMAEDGARSAAGTVAGGTDVAVADGLTGSDGGGEGGSDAKSGSGGILGIIWSFLNGIGGQSQDSTDTGGGVGLFSQPDLSGSAGAAQSDLSGSAGMSQPDLSGSAGMDKEVRYYVWAANEKNRLEKRYVEVGEYDPQLDEYQILSGLTEDDYIAWPIESLYEGVATVTSEDEVDYTSPLYNPEETEYPDDMEYLDDMGYPDDMEYLDDMGYPDDMEYLDDLDDIGYPDDMEYLDDTEFTGDGWEGGLETSDGGEDAGDGEDAG